MSFEQLHDRLNLLHNKDKPRDLLGDCFGLFVSLLLAFVME